MTEGEEHPGGNGWPVWERHVLSEQKRIAASIHELRGEVNLINLTLLARLNALHVEIAMLKVKSGIWGAIAGLMAVLGVLALRAIEWTPR